MIKFLYYITLIIAISCTSNTILKKPNDLISKKEMVNLLTDLYIAKAANKLKNKNKLQNEDIMQIIYQKYRIDSARFKRSNFYYTTKIDLCEEIFNKVEANIKAMKDSYTYTKKEKDSIKKDSIKQIQFRKN